MSSNAMNEQVVQPYAQALMSVARSNNLTEQFGEDARTLTNLLRESEQFRNFLANPFVSISDKKAVLGRVVGDNVNPYMRNFLMLLVDRRRIILLEGICQQYLALLRQLNQTVLAEVTSAVELTEEQKQAVRDKVIAMTNARQVELETRIDQSLIGGAIVKVGSQVIDASIRGQLRRLSLRLTSGT
ncbi:MAG: ATP synthase subunit delta [Chroococcidiopsis cubana SAG 39.79]|jgi:F-type H+-transporting ATPase subunit delta|uniref:ATP synthase subunit delta n=2 Tax=Chroococcidiopsis TaxID=54298 RepID=K9U5K4_CHRTP|nr:MULTISPECIES: ATP synthase F1 subunit delta [Chroococcidiopsis]MBE9015007.1 F0F1 ATP synthase subunit delta [Chroococcidiopsidales cyanobacterium LEGE 13417]PSB43485.1 F0F1 ATP synthase subunit delta [Cyanosarcina cf. burmensis CCALA 770]AFY89696.1 ATP synthase F1 subcomplex delta subunit [Chroococcidiopsis thermalis PCC 7203]MDV2995163.1 ATP synthase subunit delta [Chroococcidiopsis sp. SAG 2025]MDZ4875794.1 ATP synthase subunit delta [Chroococcidiopsis cubana SAG 39.79]